MHRLKPHKKEIEASEMSFNQNLKITFWIGLFLIFTAFFALYFIGLTEKFFSYLITLLLVDFAVNSFFNGTMGRKLIAMILFPILPVFWYILIPKHTKKQIEDLRKAEALSKKEKILM